MLNCLVGIVLCSLIYVPMVAMRLLLCASAKLNNTNRRGSSISMRCATNYCTSAIESLLGLVIVILIGFLISIVPVMFGKLTLFVGIPVLCVWWTISIIHACRGKFVEKALVKHLDQQHDTDTSRRLDENIAKTPSDATNDTNEEPVEEISFEQQPHRQQPAKINLIARLKTYPNRIVKGIKTRWLLILILTLSSVTLATVLILSTCNICIASMPTETSTWFTRKYVNRPDYACRM